MKNVIHSMLGEWNEEAINSVYTIKMRKLAIMNWTQVDIANKAIKFLTKGGRKEILDLVSGSGEFA